MEIWRDIDGYRGYQVSNFGRVRSFANNRHGLCEEHHMLNPVKGKNGRYTVCLGRGNRYLVSRLVATAFIPNPSNLPIVRHMDDDPLNNHVSNLAWGTQMDNMQDCVKHGRLVGNTVPATEAKKKKIIGKTVDGTKTLTFSSVNEAARSLKLWPQHISSVALGKLSQTGGWTFDYYSEGDQHV